jgi:hypothetical protein
VYPGATAVGQRSGQAVTVADQLVAEADDELPAGGATSRREDRSDPIGAGPCDRARQKDV